MATIDRNIEQKSLEDRIDALTEEDRKKILRVFKILLRI